MYDTAKLFRPVFVFVFLGLLLADVSLAQTCLEYRNSRNKNWFSTHEAACRDHIHRIQPEYGSNSLSYLRSSPTTCVYLVNSRSEAGTTLYNRSCKEAAKCQSKKGQKFRDGNFTYTIKGKGRHEIFEQRFYVGQQKSVGTCDDGCAVVGIFSGLGANSPNTENEVVFVSGQGAVYTGQSCSLSDTSLGLPDKPEQPPTEEETPPDPKDGIAPGWSSLPKPNEDGVDICPPGRCPGQVNGTSVCVPCDLTMSSSSSSKKTDTTNTPAGPTEPKPTDPKPGDSGSGNGSGGGDGNGSGPGSGDGKSTSTEKTDSQTTCSFGKCVTKTKKKSKDGKGTKETTEEVTQNQADYCAKNPQDEANCTKMVNAKDGKKKGDGEGSDECAKDSKRIGCLSLGEPTKGENPTKNSQEVRYQEGNFSTGSAGCPAPKTFQMFGQTYRMEFTKFCELAKYFKPLILLAASITAMFIVINGLKK